MRPLSVPAAGSIAALIRVGLPESSAWFTARLNSSGVVTWTPGDAWWDVGVPAVSARQEVREAHAAQEEGRKRQRVGV